MVADQIILPHGMEGFRHVLHSLCYRTALKIRKRPGVVRESFGDRSESFGRRSGVVRRSFGSPSEVVRHSFRVHL